jgi:putative Ca2+/H+ antiporter (TMEM165/GDT1 family)/protein-S-isoprenylcysteine O-methyltransferase Ste14
VVFVAELGDKSQLMALTFATRYRPLPVLIGISIATAVVHAVSVAVGYGLGTALPTGWIALVAAIAFFGFGAWTLRGDTLTDDEQAKAERSTGSAVVAASVAFFLAELGDKTMLATITPATRYGWFGTWLGSDAGDGRGGRGCILRRPPAGQAPAEARDHVRRLGSVLPVRRVAAGRRVRPAQPGLADRRDRRRSTTTSPGGSRSGSARHRAAGDAGPVAGCGAWAPGGRPAWRLGTPGWWARALFAAAVLLGLGAPLLVATDVVQPIALFDEPGWVAGGAAVVLLGTALLIAAQRSRVMLQQRGADPVTATKGLHARVRNPGLTGIVLATAGLLLMVPPTLFGVLAAVLAGRWGGADPGPRRAGTGLARRHGEAYDAYAARTPVPARPGAYEPELLRSGTGPRRALTGGYRASVAAPRYPHQAVRRVSARRRTGRPAPARRRPRDPPPTAGPRGRRRTRRRPARRAAPRRPQGPRTRGCTSRVRRSSSRWPSDQGSVLLRDPCRAGTPRAAISHTRHPGHRPRRG